MKDRTFTERYWDERYIAGGDSGIGSYGKFANFKAKKINKFVKKNRTKTVIEFGCGDGNQLTLAEYPKYTGLDISHKAISLCNEKFKDDKNKQFYHISEFNNHKADLILSLDVIFHLIEEETFDSYMHMICSSTTKYLIIYSSNSTDIENSNSEHLKHRRFTNWIEQHYKNLKLVKFIPNKFQYNGNYRKTSFSDFYIYKNTESILPKLRKKIASLSAKPFTS